ncbi:MAG: AAA family ATPase [Candidatus Methanomethylicia archaeon]
MNIVNEIKSKYGVIGRDVELAMILNAITSNKHVLLEGPVGVGKTKLALAVASYLNRSIYRVDGDERYTETKLTGWFDPPIVLSKGYVWDAFIPGPLTQAMLNGGILFINELNRMPEGTQNVLLPAMDEGKIIIPRLGEIQAKPGFIVIATQNPEEFVGTSRISEALRDRFVWVGLNYQSFDEEVEIVKRETGVSNDSLVKIAVEITRKTREHKDLRRGASIRGAIDIIMLTKNISNLDIQKLTEAAIMALHNKIDIQLKSNRSKKDIITEIVLSSIKKNEFNPLKPLKPKDNQNIDLDLNNTQLMIKREESIYKSMSTLIKEGEILKSRETQGFKPNSRWLVIKHYVSDDVDEDEKIAIESYVCRAIVSLAAEISEKGMRRYRKRIEYPSSPVFSENFDLEQTIENYYGKPFMDYRDIAIINKIPRKLAVALILDASNSMHGYRIIMAALAVAALAYKLEKDYYSIVAFKDEAKVLKSIDEETSIENIVSKILHFKYGGLTNIEDGLRKGLEQIEQLREDVSDRLGIIVTDGWVTAGRDPLDVAAKYSKLHVLQIGIGGGRLESVELAESMAKVGHGIHILIEGFNELPYALMNILRL